MVRAPEQAMGPNGDLSEQGEDQKETAFLVEDRRHRPDQDHHHGDMKHRTDANAPQKKRLLETEERLQHERAGQIDEIGRPCPVQALPVRGVAARYGEIEPVPGLVELGNPEQPHIAVGPAQFAVHDRGP